MVLLMLPILSMCDCFSTPTLSKHQQCKSMRGTCLYTKASTEHILLQVMQCCINSIGKLFELPIFDRIGDLCLGSFKVENFSRTFSTSSALEFVDLTNWVVEATSVAGIKNGLVHVFAPHATGILILTENDPALLNDVKTFLEKLVPELDSYHHPSNAHAHLRSMLLPPDKTLPVIGGKVQFGTWQSLMFVETDVYPRKRTLTLQIMGET